MPVMGGLPQQVDFQIQQAGYQNAEKLKSGIAPLNAARTSQRDVPTMSICGKDKTARTFVRAVTPITP
jgi:hypothetical protein